MVNQPKGSKLGLPKETMIRMLRKDIPDLGDALSEIIDKRLIPNIAEVIAANNEAILFQLKK